MILVPLGESWHARVVTVKSAAFLAFLGSLLLSVLLLWRLVMDILNVAQSLVPAVSLVSSLLYAFASVTAAIFFFVLQSNQPR